MDILGKARRLESRIARRLDGAVEDFVGSGAREPLEIVHAVVAAVESQIQPGGRGTRLFPFNRIALSIRAPSRDVRARFEALFAAEPSLHDRIVERLRSAGCAVDELAVDTAYVARAAKSWGHQDFHLDFDRTTRAVTRERRDESKPARVELTVLRGSAEHRTYSFAAQRIDLGRCTEVRDNRNRLIRTNHVAFVEGTVDVNQSVSRRHAHIGYEPTSGEYRLYDDDSVHGTSIVRDGRSVAVSTGSRGVRLRSGDEVVLGEARVRITLR